ncbi:MAG: stage II sporulation protein P [bacterium]|nr:stage II sporulation protein P [bacterium]
MDEQSKGEIGEEPTTKGELAAKVDEEEGKEATQTQLPQNENAFSLPYSQEQLADYDFLIQKVYNVHSSTTAPREVMNAETFLEKDFSLEQGGEEPQILIYHSHSQETYLEEGAGEDGASVVALGKVLSACLEERGYRVLHDSTVYDLRDGKLDRSKAYTYALEGILGILTQHPSIEVVIDLHRDGVPENVHLVSEIDGKQTAQLMFFNGMSQTPSGPIAYLENPYREDNLAFSFQLQMAAMSRYPGLTRKIFLKGLRYNLHVRPRSLLIEVGAQNNSFEEAQNAMEPLADILAQVLAGT